MSVAPPAGTRSRDDATTAANGEAVIEALRTENALLRAENAALIGRLEELARRLGLNSNNNSKPPSSDGLKELPRANSPSEPSGKRSGGQKGHPGEALCQLEKPDATIDHYAEVCAASGKPLTVPMATAQVAQQVFDLPEQVGLHDKRF